MTATHRDVRWLFPGRRAGQPMTPETLELRLRHLGFPTQRGRTAAIRRLVLQAPAPVVARMLGYHDDTTAQLATEAGGTLASLRPWRPRTVTMSTQQLRNTWLPITRGRQFHTP
jgi:hypothetical protein